MTKESVIDFPKEQLCPDVWDKVVGDDGVQQTWILNDNVQQIITSVCQSIAKETSLPFDKLNVRITGSITSNQYTENADIDLHFSFVDGFAIREFSEMTQKRFKKASDNLKHEFPELFSIVGHPLEIYYQPNKFQDFMSIGCYDVKTSKWLVGPELKDQSYNPYSDLYKDIKEKSEQLISSIRQTILYAYEKAIVYKKVSGKQSAEMIAEATDDFISSISTATNLYQAARQSRKTYSSPTSIEEALKMRNSRHWKIADATFKLMDKFGYLAILKKFSELNEVIQNELCPEIADSVILTTKEFIGNADKLTDSEKVDEGIKNGIAIGLLASLLAVPGIVQAKTVQHALTTNKGHAQVTQTINKQCKMVGEYTAFQAANIIARTLYAEARSDGVDNGYKPVASVIYNRAEKKKENFAKACLKKWQFSCWNGLEDSQKEAKNFKITIPSSVQKSAANQKLWKQAMEIAAEMLAGTFKPVTTANSYYATSMKKPPSWGKELTGTKVIGGHKFGFLKNHSKFI